MATNLPQNTEITDSPDRTKLIFNSYGSKPLEFSAIEVDATIAWFQKRGFGDQASEAVAVVLLTQAKKQNVPVLSILDTIKLVDEAQLSAFVSKVLNRDRVQTSTLGYRVEFPVTNKTRNILE